MQSNSERVPSRKAGEILRKFLIGETPGSITHEEASKRASFRGMFIDVTWQIHDSAPDRSDIFDLVHNQVLQFRDLKLVC